MNDHMEFKVECLKKCRDMWQKLAENPCMSKSSAVGQEVISNDCWMCHYTSAVGSNDGLIDCDICPPKWSSEAVGNRTRCERAGSEYLEWCNADMDGRVVAALKIVKLCDDALKGMMRVANTPFNQENYADLIGQIYENPPAYAQMETV